MNKITMPTGDLGEALRQLEQEGFVWSPLEDEKFSVSYGRKKFALSADKLLHLYREKKLSLAGIESLDHQDPFA